MLQELAQQSGRPEWQPGLRRLVAYGLLEKVGESTRGGRRAYYRMPDRFGVEEALNENPALAVLMKRNRVNVGPTRRRCISTI